MSDAPEASSGRVKCGICPAACNLREGQLGRCGARQAQGGEVVDQNYAKVTSLALDPIEKKPLAMYMQGSKVLSVGSFGCNLDCPFCQNSGIACAAQDDVDWRCLPPDDLVELALKLRSEGNIGLAYTYNEPLVGWEFVYDASRLIHEAEMKNVLVSNGFVNEDPLIRLLPFIDAANIDLKSFDPSFYRSIGGDLDVVKRTIRFMAEAPNCHLEVTTLVVPGISDSPEQMDEMSAWLASLDPDIPYHLSRFFPCHKMSGSRPTDVPTLYEMREIAERHLHHVFLGNV